ncbi:MAG TPA: PPC domain-containing DNA-binding protein [Bryobacteraceae bacterium]|nr:PPC domain-containing DNA-binding protein [Bryobacteraceae bacterium]
MNFRCATAGRTVFICALSAAGVLPLAANAADAAPQAVFGGAQIQEVYRIRLDRGDPLLESIEAVIKERNIQDGIVLTGVGSLETCTYHAASTLAPSAEDKYFTVKGPMELLNLDGVIAAGEPHIHMTMSKIGKGAFGGHLEKGCKVLYRVEITIAKTSGPPLERKLNSDGTPALQLK